MQGWGSLSDMSFVKMSKSSPHEEVQTWRGQFWVNISMSLKQLKNTLHEHSGILGLITCDLKIDLITYKPH